MLLLFIGKLLWKPRQSPEALDFLPFRFFPRFPFLSRAFRNYPGFPQEGFPFSTEKEEKSI